jgi:hypothetical protein
MRCERSITSLSRIPSEAVEGSTQAQPPAPAAVTVREGC